MGTKAFRLINILRSHPPSPWRRWMTTLSPSPPPSLSKGNKKETVTALVAKLKGLKGSYLEAKVDCILNDQERGLIASGHSFPRPLLATCVAKLRRLNNYRVALHLYQWIEEKNEPLYNSDHAIRIDLLAKTKGVAAAENYFNSLEESAKAKETYGALLCCYCQRQMVEEATKLFQAKTARDFLSTSLSYNNMMALFMKVGQPEKVPFLVQEMEEKNIALDLYSYNYLMNSYVALQDMDAVERVLENMKSKGIKYDWFTLRNIATIFINAGWMDKGNATLEELEQKVSTSKDPVAYNTLIDLYSRSSNAAGVNRAWELCKLKFSEPNNACYFTMLSSLLKLGDFNDLDKLFREWESICSSYEIKIPNVVLESYLKRDMIDEGIILYDSLALKGAKPNLTTEDLFMQLCSRKCLVDSALQCLEDGTSGALSRVNDRFPHPDSVNAFLTYFREEKDVHAACIFREIMTKIDRLDAEMNKVLNEVCTL